jgi:hypothetical protein
MEQICEDAGEITGGKEVVIRWVIQKIIAMEAQLVTMVTGAKLEPLSPGLSISNCAINWLSTSTRLCLSSNPGRHSKELRRK